jgi:predicted ABC-type transport system involved in lysophospholipase L1 biosynthesis ATPase subunit
MSRTSWKMFSPSGLSMNAAPTACVVTWSENSVEADRVEQTGRVGRPALDRVRLARVVRGPVAARGEREQPEVLAEAVVDEPEVVAAEEPAAELEDDRCVVGAGELVVETDSVLDLRVRHTLLLERALCDPAE